MARKHDQSVSATPKKPIGAGKDASVDPVTAALLLAVATGTGESVGGKVWDGLSSLIHRWFKRGKAGEDEVIDDLERLGQDNGAAEAAARLAKALTGRADTDAAFRAELAAWQATAGQVYVQSTVITGGTQGTVVTVGRVENLTIHAPGQPAPSRGTDGGLAPGQAGFALLGEDATPIPAGLLIQIREAVMRMPSQPPKSLAGLPPRVGGFARQGELDALLSTLDPAAGDGGASIAAVVGPPGVGKTTLAVEAGHVAQEVGWFPGGVLFLNLHGYDAASLQPTDVMSSALRALGVAAEHVPEASMDQATSLYRSMLAEFAKPVLILADNASSAAQVQPLLPGAGRHRVLVTSRLTMPELGAREFRLLPMAEAEAITMLDAELKAHDPRDARIAAHPGEAARLARSCGCLPLALEITARVLVSRASMTVADLAEELADRRTRIDRLDQLSRRDDMERGVRAAFDVSYEQLSPASARLLRLCAASPGPDLATDAVAALAGDDRSTTVAALDDLDRAHLIMPAADRGRWQIHDLLREYAEQEAHADGQEEAHDRLLDYYLHRANRATETLLSASDHIQGSGTFATWRDAAQWFEAERLNLLAAVTLAAETERTRIAYLLAVQLTGLAIVQRYPECAETLAEIGLDAARGEGGESAELAMALTNFAHIQQQAGHADKAIAAFRDAIRILRNLRDPAEELTEVLGGALGGLGSSLLESGQPEAAIATLEEAVAEARTHESRFYEVQALVRLGTALTQTRQYDEAIAIQRQAVAAAVGTHNAFHQGVAFVGLSAALRAVRRYEEAITAARQAVDTFRDAGVIPMESTAQHGLGTALWGAGKRKESLAAHRRAAELMRQTGNDSAEGASLTEFADELRSASRPKDAVSVYQEAITLFARAGDRNGEARAQQRLGWTLHGLKRYAESLAAFERAAGIFAAAGDRTGEANALTGRGDTLRETRDLVGAVNCHQRAASMHQQEANRKGRSRAIKGLGKDLAKIRRLDVDDLLAESEDPCETGRALVNIAEALLDLGRFAEAVPPAERAAAIMRELGDRKAECRALNVQGRGLHCLKRFKEATDAHRRDLALSLEAGDSRGAGIAHGNIGYALNAMGRLDEAAAEWREAAAILEDVHEPEDLGWVFDGLGDVLVGLRQYEEAAGAYQRAIDLLRLTPDRRTEAAALAGLAFTWFFQGRYDQAANSFGRAAKLAGEADEWVVMGRLRGYRINARIRYRKQRLRRRKPGSQHAQSLRP
jgi:tetratricopeptide (TPR) repeat protein